MTISVATALGLAAVAAVFAIGWPAYRRTAGWFSLAAIGQGAMLAMIDAGPFPGYQHYATLSAISARAPWLLAVVGAQTLLVGAGWWQDGVIRGLRQSGIPAWRLTLALALSVATAATVSADARRYVAELAFAIALQLLAAATIVLGARAWPVSAMRRLESGVSRLLGSDEPATGHADRTFAWTAAMLATVLAAALNVLAYERHPHVPDEVVYLHHAKYLAEGQLELPALAVPAAFDVDLMEYEPARWFSPVPPGWPAALAIGAWAGVPWLVNPLLAGLNILLAFSLLSRLYSGRMARAASLLLAFSPWFLFLGMSYMTHHLTLSAALLAAVGVVRARESGAGGWGLLAGVGVGVTSLIRPLDGVIIGALIGAWALGAGGTRLRFAPLSGLVIGTALIGALVLPYNRMLTGDPLRFPINAYNDKHHAVNSNAYWFGPDRGMGWPTDPNPGHSPVDGVINANLNTFGINTDLFGWFTGSLIFVTWLVCSGTWRRQDSLMMTVVFAFGLVYFPYYFSGGPDFGARYWFPVIVPLVALSVRGIQAFELRTDARVWLAVGVLSLMTLVTYVPWRSVDKYHHYRGMRADIRALAVEHGFGADLVLVRGNRFPDYASAFAQNPVDLSSPVTIYAWDRDAQTRVQVLREYANRRVWLLDGPSVTGAGYRLSGGPIEARALLAGAPR